MNSKEGSSEDDTDLHGDYLWSGMDAAGGLISVLCDPDPQGSFLES